VLNKQGGQRVQDSSRGEWARTGTAWLAGTPRRNCPEHKVADNSGIPWMGTHPGQSPPEALGEDNGYYHHPGSRLCCASVFGSPLTLWSLPDWEVVYLQQVESWFSPKQSTA
jgi:hypothetical protein